MIEALIQNFAEQRGWKKYNLNERHFQVKGKKVITLNEKGFFYIATHEVLIKVKSDNGIFMPTNHEITESVRLHEGNIKISNALPNISDDVVVQISMIQVSERESKPETNST